MTSIGVAMASEESLLSLAEVTDRLQIRSQHYAGIKTIPVGANHRHGGSDRRLRPTVPSAPDAAAPPAAGAA